MRIKHIQRARTVSFLFKNRALVFLKRRGRASHSVHFILLLTLILFLRCPLRKVVYLLSLSFTTLIPFKSVSRATVLEALRVTRSTAEVFTWSERPEGCLGFSKVKGAPFTDNNLVCFDVDFGSRLQQYYTFLTPFEKRFSFYLGVARDFLVEVGETNKLKRKVVWMLGDDGTIPSPVLSLIHGVGVASVAHSVNVAINNSTSYTTLVPNFHYIQYKGFQDISGRLKAAPNKPYAQRKRQLIWAGSTTGLTCRANEPCVRVCDETERVQLVRRFQNISWLNFRLTRAVQSCNGHEEWLRSIDLLRNELPEEYWATHQAILDIDGNVDAWGLLWRLQTGSTVFRVQSSFENYFTKSLSDGIHFISIARDLSNLLEKSTIIRSNERLDQRYLVSVARAAKHLVGGIKYSNVVKEVAEKLKVG